jgi:hypothetical protein
MPGKRSHEDEGRYDASAAFTLGGTPATGDHLMFGVAYPTGSTHSVSTRVRAWRCYQRGFEAGIACTAAGTTAGTKPAFTDVSVPDNGVTWERDSEGNNSAVRKVVRLQYSGSVAPLAGVVRVPVHRWRDGLGLLDR